MSTRIFAGALALAAVGGLLFAGVSTLDFVQHLDRQMHDLHCSFAPGLIEADTESTGCQVTLLSPYSSVMRTSLWGGIPISLPAMAVFAFLLFRATEVITAPPARQRRAAAIALWASLVPVGASAVMGYLAFTELHAACKLCIGIYICSGVALLMALLAWLKARSPASRSHAENKVEGSASPPPPRPGGVAWVVAAGQALAFVAVPVVAYAMVAPDYARFIGTCGALAEPDDAYGMMVDMGAPGQGVPSVEVFDPLCPACRGFEERLQASGLDARLQRKAVMFPLDSECNWMISRSPHPGACRVSEAVLCADGEASVPVDAVVQWAFEHQEELLEAGKKDLASVSQRLTTQFPALAGCLGSAEVKSRLNKSLRWTVKNELPVMTPQLFVAGVKLCDEDSDLGLDYMLHQMLERHAAGSLASTTPANAPAGEALVPGSVAPPAEAEPARKSTKTRAAPSKARPTTAEPAKPAPTKPEPTEPEPAEPEPATAEPTTKLPSVEQLPPPNTEDDSEPTP